MKKNILIAIFATGFIALINSGCTKAPQAEIDAAYAAVDSAKTAGADIYAHESFVALQDSMDAIIISIEAQKSKMIKQYGTAKEDLANIVSMAQTVMQQSEHNKATMIAEIQSTISEVKSLIETNRNLTTEAPKGKEGAAAIEAIKEEINVIENSVTEAEVLFNNGEYASTLDKVKAAKSKADAINVELNEVISKHKARKG